MQVNIEFEAKDDAGETNKTQCFAVMEKNTVGYRLVYVEDMSGDGKMTRSTLNVSPYEMRIIRNGELNMDFIFGDNMVHNTSYITPYGNMPVTVETKSYSFKTEGDIDSSDFAIKAETEYYLILHGQKPMNMGMKVCITKREKDKIC